MLRKILSIVIISSLSLGIIACNKTDNSKNQANKNSKPPVIESSVKKDSFIISKNDYKNLKTVLNIHITNLLQNNFHSNQDIKRVIVTQKRKTEDENKKDVYIFFDIEKNKINNVNSEEVSNKAVKTISKNNGVDFWEKHNVTIFFKTSDTDFIPYTTYITKQGSDKLLKAEIK